MTTFQLFSSMSEPPIATCRFGQACTDPSCGLDHSVAVCKVCNINFASQETYRKHLYSQRHKKNAAGQPVALVRCPLCDSHMTSGSTWLAHIQGSGHRVKAKMLGVSPDVQPEQPAESAAGFKLCVSCNFYVSEKGWKRHEGTKMHISKIQFSNYRTALNEAEQDKHNVTLSGEFDFDVVEPATARAGVTARGSIQTTLSSSQIKLVQYALASLNGGAKPSSYAVFFLPATHSHASKFYSQCRRNQSCTDLGDPNRVYYLGPTGSDWESRRSRGFHIRRRFAQKVVYDLPFFTHHIRQQGRS